MENFINKTCSNCGSVKFKNGENLTEDEKFLVERLPNKEGFTIEQRKKQRFCKRCFYSVDDQNIRNV